MHFLWTVFSDQEKETSYCLVSLLKHPQLWAFKSELKSKPCGAWRGKISKASGTRFHWLCWQLSFHQWPHVDPYLTPLCNSAWWRHTHFFSFSHSLFPSSHPTCFLKYLIPIGTDYWKLMRIERIYVVFTKDGCLRMHHKGWVFNTFSDPLIHEDWNIILFFPNKLQWKVISSALLRQSSRNTVNQE